MLKSFRNAFIVIMLLLGPVSWAQDSVLFKTYNFNELSTKLGYPSDNFFGSSEEEILDLDTYTTKDDTFYRDINLYLRSLPNKKIDWTSVNPEDSAKIVKSIDAIYKRVPALPSDLILFRGIDLNYRNNKSFDRGGEYIEKGYVSTSSSFKVANYFANEINDNATSSSLKALMVLYSNKPGLKGILIDQGEDEVLLSHGEKIKIMEVDKSKKYDLYLVQICSTICEAQTKPSALNAFNKISKH